MLNILIPMVGRNIFPDAEYQYIKPLIEICGKPLIELVVDCLDKINQEKRFIFIVNAEDCHSFHLDKVLNLITKDKAVIIKLEKETQGAACSALMAIDYINNSEPLLISSSDHIIDYDLNIVIEQFNSKLIDAGTVCFDSIHPQWSFARLDDRGRIIETAEKKPLSRNAIAGLYYFRFGSDFVDASMSMIEKDAQVNGKFYIAPSLNELILNGKNMEIFNIPSSKYHNFYSSQKIKEFEMNSKEFNL